MTWHREKLAQLYQEAIGNSEVKIAARGGQRHSRKKVDKKRVDSLEGYHKAKSKFQELKEKKRDLEAQLEKAKQDMQDCRGDMLRYNDVLRNMDLLACKHVVLYNNSDDIGYVVDKEEHHLDVDDCGDVSLTPMKEYRRYLKQQNQETNEANDQDVNEADDQESDLIKYDPSPDDSPMYNVGDKVRRRDGNGEPWGPVVEITGVQWLDQQECYMYQHIKDPQAKYPNLTWTPGDESFTLIERAGGDSFNAHDGAVGSLIPGLDKLTDAESSWNDNEFTEGKFPSRHPNLRFGE